MGQGDSKRLKVKANKFKKVSHDAYKELKAYICHFCNKEGHYQKDFLKRKAWVEKKGMLSALYVSNQI